MALLDTTEAIKNIKLDLGLSDTLQDDVFQVLLGRVVDHFMVEYGVDEIEDKFAFIIEDCVIKRFNRRGSEGASAESVEGHSVSYYANESEFKPYDKMLQREFGRDGLSSAGSVMFL